MHIVQRNKQKNISSIKLFRFNEHPIYKSPGEDRFSIYGRGKKLAF